jgi:hypothetical protein
MGTITEIKHHLNKPTERYVCDVLGRGRDWVTVSYTAERDYRLRPLTIPAGSRTIARYEHGRPYVRWDMSAPDGRPLGRLFHLCRDLTVSEDRIEYVDMLLDVWAWPDGRAEVLDDDELEACVREGKVAPAEAECLRCLARRIARGDLAD